MKDLHLSWNDVEVAVAMLSVWLYENYMCKIDHIVGIARGGLPIATMLAHQLGVRSVSTIQIQTYEDKARVGPSKEFYLPTDLFPNETTTAVVDDIVDTGCTMRIINESYPRVVKACLVGKLGWLEHVNYVGRKVEKSCWVRFPWEDSEV